MRENKSTRRMRGREIERAERGVAENRSEKNDGGKEGVVGGCRLKNMGGNVRLTFELVSRTYRNEITIY